MYVRLTRLVGDKLIISTASEEEWFDNIVELGWRLYLCSSPPYTLQTKLDRRMREYTDLAFAGDVLGLANPGSFAPRPLTPGPLIAALWTRARSTRPRDCPATLAAGATAHKPRQ